MRTGPVALAYLGEPDRIAEAAREISGLTHGDPLCGDACVLWCLAIDRAVRDGVFDLAGGLDWLPAPRRDRVGRATSPRPRPSLRPTSLATATWSSPCRPPGPPSPTPRCRQDEPCRHLQDTLVAAVRIGHDTDTVAAIAGALLGARWGSSAVPLAVEAAAARLARVRGPGPDPPRHPRRPARAGPIPAAGRRRPTCSPTTGRTTRPSPRRSLCPATRG